MTRPSDPNRSADDLLFLLAVGLLGMASVGHWLVGNVAALLGKGRLLHAGVADALAALSRLSDHWGDPRHAWPEPAASNLPGPIVYWASVAVVAAGAVAAGTFAMSVAGQRRHEPIDRRSRLGVAAQPHLARRKDLRPLLTARPERGRFVIARQGRRYVCTEAASCRHRRGVRGAVAVFGPSQSGKTTGLVGGVTAWHGPAIISSVKADLAPRSRRDPPRAPSWSSTPLAQVAPAPPPGRPCEEPAVSRAPWQRPNCWPEPVATTARMTGFGAAKPSN